MMASNKYITLLTIVWRVRKINQILGSGVVYPLNSDTEKLNKRNER